MPIDWDSPEPFDTHLQRALAEWLVHVKAGRNPARDDADTEADPVQFEEEDFETFEAFALERLDVGSPEELRSTLEQALGFSAWTSAF